MDPLATARRAPAGQGQQLSSRMDDRRSRFLQMDAQPHPQPLSRVDLICPQPRRACRHSALFESLGRATSPKPIRALPVYIGDPASEVLDLILSKNGPEADTDSSSQVALFCGSPPVRTNNPVVHDPMFGEKLPSFSPLGSIAERLDVGVSSPKVRIEGFACGGDK